MVFAAVVIISIARTPTAHADDHIPDNAVIETTTDDQSLFIHGQAESAMDGTGSGLVDIPRFSSDGENEEGVVISMAEENDVIGFRVRGVSYLTAGNA